MYIGLYGLAFNFWKYILKLHFSYTCRTYILPHLLSCPKALFRVSTVPDRDIRSELARPTRPAGCSLWSRIMCYFIYCFCAICVILACDIYLGWFTSTWRFMTSSQHHHRCRSRMLWRAIILKMSIWQVVLSIPGVNSNPLFYFFAG